MDSINIRGGAPECAHCKRVLKADFHTRYDFVAYDKLTTGLRHELFRVNQTYNLLTTAAYVKKKKKGVAEVNRK